MENIYYDISNPAGFGGVNRLTKISKQPYSKVNSFINKQKVYRKNKTPKQKFKRARIVVSTFGVQWQADLFDLQKFGRLNSGFKWILLVVDAFSRLVKCEPLKNKTGIETARGLDKIFTELAAESKLAPLSSMGTDAGNEFFNKWCTDVYKKHGISHFPLRAPKKAALAEISGRYIVEKLYKFMDHKSTKRWIDSLASVVVAKNSRKNTKTANLSPIEINYTNQKQVHHSLYPNYGTMGTFTLNIGDRVQIVKSRLPFAKAHQGYWSTKTYRVITQHEYDVPRYSIADEEDDEPIAGTWYAEELYKI